MLEIFCMVSIFFVLESLFCFIAKKHEIISKRHEEEGGGYEYITLRAKKN